jgi:hypothetical protein
LGVIGIDASRFAITLQFFFGRCCQNAANVIFDGVQADGRDAGHVFLFRHRKIGADKTK